MIVNGAMQPGFFGDEPPAPDGPLGVLRVGDDVLPVKFLACEVLGL